MASGPENPRVALVTGGEGDLAHALVSALEKNGYLVHAPGRNELDVLDPKSISRYFKGIDRLDLLVANAGTTCDKLIARTSEEDWRLVIDTNLKGAFLCAQAALRPMAKQRSGHLVFLSSRSALAGPIGQSSYAASKAGLHGLAKSIAKEYGPRGIRANCLLPGFLETKMTRELLETRVEEILADHLLGRLSKPEDAAHFLVLLDKMEAVSGQIFQLDNRVERW